MSVALLLVVASSALGAERRVFPWPTPVWLVTQQVQADTVRPELRWQVTPVLFSFGAHPKTTRWRTLVVEPRLRHGGSVELFVAPMLRLGPSTELNVRPGLRATFPAVEFGETLSVSLGLQYQRLDSHDGLGLELGVYALLGIVGVQVMAVVEPSGPSRTYLTLALRYF
jgi:hypothetical protein